MITGPAGYQVKQSIYFFFKQKQYIHNTYTFILRLQNLPNFWSLFHNCFYYVEKVLKKSLFICRICSIVYPYIRQTKPDIRPGTGTTLVNGAADHLNTPLAGEGRKDPSLRGAVFLRFELVCWVTNETKLINA